jgi:DNA-directed RNA polymerase specialized sigma24 family protein
MVTKAINASKDTGEASLNDVVLQLKINNRLAAAQLRGEPLAYHDLALLLAGTGASYQEIAEVLDKSPNAIRKLLERERHKSSEDEKKRGSANDGGEE